MLGGLVEGQRHRALHLDRQHIISNGLSASKRGVDTRAWQCTCALTDTRVAYQVPCSVAFCLTSLRQGHFWTLEVSKPQRSCCLCSLTPDTKVKITWALIPGFLHEGQRFELRSSCLERNCPYPLFWLVFCQPDVS